MALASAVAIACGLRLMATDHEQAGEYARLAATSPAAASGEGAWEELDRTNPDVVAWLRVEGTSVDVPVCQASADDPDYYLYHDLWGDAVEVGNPYLDARCGPDAPEMTVYGHHTTVESYMFHDLSGVLRTGGVRRARGRDVGGPGRPGGDAASPLLHKARQGRPDVAGLREPD